MNFLFRWYSKGKTWEKHGSFSNPCVSFTSHLHSKPLDGPAIPPTKVIHKSIHIFHPWTDELVSLLSFSLQHSKIYAIQHQATYLLKTL